MLVTFQSTHLLRSHKLRRITPIESNQIRSVQTTITITTNTYKHKHNVSTNKSRNSSKMLKFCVNSIVVLIMLIEHSDSAATGTAMDQQQHSSATLDLPFKINEDCHQPRETGRCFALFHRFAFNVEKRTCEEFIYGGCGGNKNNFETLIECENMCRILADDELVTTTTVASSNATVAPAQTPLDEVSSSTSGKQLSDTDTESSTATATSAVAAAAAAVTTARQR